MLKYLATKVNVVLKVAVAIKIVHIGCFQYQSD